MKICFCIRFHYKKDDPRFEWRFNYFKNEVLSRIKKQTYLEFDICIWCNDYHKKLFEYLGCKTFIVISDPIRYKQNKNRPEIKYFHDFVKFDECIGLDKYDLQLGLDSDDLIIPIYLEKVIFELNKNILENPNKSIHLCFIPEMIDIKTKKIKPLGRYSENRGSAFMALYQPDKTNYRFIYEESHISIIKKADIKVILPIGYCYASVHSFNESTGK